MNVNHLCLFLTLLERERERERKVKVKGRNKKRMKGHEGCMYKSAYLAFEHQLEADLS